METHNEVMPWLAEQTVVRGELFREEKIAVLLHLKTYTPEGTYNWVSNSPSLSEMLGTRATFPEGT